MSALRWHRYEDQQGRTCVPCVFGRARQGRDTPKYESVPYMEAVDAFMRGLGTTLDSAPRGNDTAQMDAEIEALQINVDAGEIIVGELLDTVISDKSRAARLRLRDAERELEQKRDSLRNLMERRDTLTSTNVKKRLAAVEQAFVREPLDTEEANKALRGAVRKMVMRPQEGTLDILWHHADVPQETVFTTSRFDWNAHQIEDREQGQ